MNVFTRVMFAGAVAAVVLLSGTAPAMAKAADRNHNKIPDSWEKKYHLSIKKSQAKKDTDKDGLTNINEYLAGTNPRKKDTNHNGRPDGLEDRDHDGLVNVAEVAAHTNIKVADTDHDGVLDGAEDPDGDTLDNSEEFTAGTNPLLEDSDANGVGDAFEDADDDGLENAQEFQAGTNPRMKDSDHDGIDDSHADGDHDGVDNRDEFADGTDPRNPDSDNDGVEDGQELRGTIESFDAATGALVLVSDADGETTVAVTVDSATVLTWLPQPDDGSSLSPDGGSPDEGAVDGVVESGVEGDVPTDVNVLDATVDDLTPGTRVCRIETVTRDDGSLLATRIVLAPEQIDDPVAGPDVSAEVVAWDPDTSMLTVQPSGEDEPAYDVYVDEATEFCWADGTIAGHDAGADDLTPGAGIADISVSYQEDGPLLATQIVLVPAAQ